MGGAGPYRLDRVKYFPFHILGVVSARPVRFCPKYCGGIDARCSSARLFAGTVGVVRR